MSFISYHWSDLVKMQIKDGDESEALKAVIAKIEMNFTFEIEIISDLLDTLYDETQVDFTPLYDFLKSVTTDNECKHLIQAKLHRGYCGHRVSIEKAKEIFEKYEESAFSQHHLGAICLNEAGTTHDVPNAIIHFEKAAAKGHVASLFSLGCMYQSGQFGCEKNGLKSLEYLTKADEKGHKRASYSIGILYRDGCGVEQDFQKAVSYFDRSITLSGSPFAMCTNGMIYQNGMGNVAKDSKKAFEYFVKAAQLGHGQAYYLLGCMYRDGDGVEQDLEKSNSYFQLAQRR